MPQENGKRIYAVASDVSHRKQVEAELRASEQHYRQLLEAVTSYTYSLEIRDGCAAVNRPQCGVSGCHGLHSRGPRSRSLSLDQHGPPR